MYNTMTSIRNYVVNHASTFGLASEDDLKVIGKTKQTLPDGAKWLIINAIKTVPNNTSDGLFGGFLITGAKMERFLTQMRFEVKTRSPDSNNDFLWDTAQQFRDKVYTALKGSQQSGLVLPRYDWTQPENPVKAGEIWFEVNPATSPVEEILEDPNDPANKSILLTYNVHWWISSPTPEVRESDPWLEALELWTKSELGEGWAVSDSTYPQVSERPAVIWSLVGISTKQITSSLFEVSKTFTAEVFGLLPNQHSSGCRAIMEGLSRDVKIALDTTNKKYATVITPQMEIPLHSISKGQVTVTLTEKTSRPQEEIALMMKIKTEGSWQ